MGLFSGKFEADILRSPCHGPTADPAKTQFFAHGCGLSQSACMPLLVLLHSLHPLILCGVSRRKSMSYLTQHTHKVLALVLALVITAGIQGTLLAGFEQMASAAPAPIVVASCE
jgi:hypothetical protein